MPRSCCVLTCGFMHPAWVNFGCHPLKAPCLQAACEAEQQGSLPESQALAHTRGGDLSRRGGVVVEASLQQVPVRASSALPLCSRMCYAVCLSMSSLAWTPQPRHMIHMTYDTSELRASTLRGALEVQKACELANAKQNL